MSWTIHDAVTYEHSGPDRPADAAVVVRREGCGSGDPQHRAQGAQADQDHPQPEHAVAVVLTHGGELP